MFIEVSFENFHFRITVDEPLSAIIGDTATGKTAFISAVRKMQSTGVKTDATTILTEVTLDILPFLPSGTALLLDLDAMASCDILDALSRDRRNDIYVIVFGRKWLRRLPLDCANVYKLITVKGITKNVPFCDEELTSLLEFSKVVTEDSRSGNNYMKCIFDNVVSSKGAANLLKEDYSQYLKIFDTVGFGAYLEEFLSTYRNTPYLGWPSFEGYILKEVYGENLLDYFEFNKEVALTERLQALNINYGKSSACYSEGCYSCNKFCKINPKQVFENSAYGEFLKVYTRPSKSDDIVDILDELGISAEYRSQIEKYLPNAKVSKDILRNNIQTIARDFLKII